MIITRSGVAVRPLEARSMMLSGWPNGYGLTDPSAIPPPGLNSMQRAGVPVNTHTVLQVDSVSTATRVLSNMIIGLGDPRPYAEELDQDNNPYPKWLPPSQFPVLTDTWIPGMFQYDGQSRTVMSLALFSEAWWYELEADAMQYPTCMEVLNPALVDTSKREKDGTLWYGAGSSKVELDPGKITYIPFMAMPGATRGLSSIEYAGVAFALALAAMEYGQRWFAQGASPSYILTTEQKLGQPEVDRIAEKFLLEHSGLSKAHLPLILDSGLKANKTQATPDEAQFLGTLEYARRIIAAYFGLPTHLVGGTTTGNTWGGTVEQMFLQMIIATISGYTVRLNQAYSSLLPKGIKARLDESPLLTPDMTSLAKYIQMSRTAGVETANEIRVSRLRRPPLEGGDSLISPLNSNTSPGVGGVFAEEVADDLDLPDEPAPDAAA